MSVRLRARVAQLSVVDGIRQKRAHNLGAAVRSSLIPIGTGKGNLYLLVDLTGDPTGKRELCRVLIDIVSKEYRRVPGGITNGLRQAIRAANSFLHQNNEYSPPERRRTGEVCCAVLRGNDLYMGLAGHALIYVVRGHELRVFPPQMSLHPAHSPPDEQPTLPSLGADPSLLEVGLFHCQIELDDTVLLTSSTLPRLASQEQLIRTAEAGLGEMVRSLTSLASQSDLSALLIQTEVEEGQEAAEMVSRAATGRSVLSTVGVGKVPAYEVAGAVKKIPLKRVASGIGMMTSALWASLIALFARMGSGLKAFLSWLVSSGILETLGQGMRVLSARILRGSGTMAKRMLPEPTAAPQRLETAHAHRAELVSAPPRSGRLPPLLGVLAVVCAITLISTGVVIYNRSRTDSFTPLLEEARAERELARDSSAPTAIREHLAKARELAEQALLMRPSDPEAAALQEEVFIALDKIDRVVRLKFSAHVPFIEPENQPRRILMQGSDAYVLDQGTQRLYGYVLDDLGVFQEPAGGAVLLGQENRPGGVALQELYDFVWMESGNGRDTSNLLLLVNGSSVLQLDGLRGFTSVSIADSQLWGEAFRIGGYSGYFYVLDTVEDRIWKYTPTGNSYDLSPTNYFQEEASPELDNAVDMAIDGYVYVLLADGDILRFAGGEEQAFSISGLEDHELQNPTALFASPQTEYIYVADSGNERVVQLDKEGAFVRQFRPDREDAEAFGDLRDVFVSETDGALFVLNSDGLYLALIPELLQAE